MKEKKGTKEQKSEWILIAEETELVKEEEVKTQNW